MASGLFFFFNDFCAVCVSVILHVLCLGQAEGSSLTGPLQKSFQAAILNMEDYLTKRALGHITPYHHFFGDTSASSSGLVGDSMSNVSKLFFFLFLLESKLRRHGLISKNSVYFCILLFQKV